MAKITVRGTEVTIITIDEKDYISLTDMVNISEQTEPLISAQTEPVITAKCATC